MNELRCPRCGLAHEENDNFCRRCGRSLKPGRGFMNSHVGIIVMALIVGPFALPWVWTSKRISVVSKWIYTIILLAIGYYLIIACWKIYQMIAQSTQMLMGAF